MRPFPVRACAPDAAPDADDATMTHDHDLAGRLLELAARQPDMPALIAPGRAATTFASLARRLRSVEGQLAQWGIRRGDVVAWSNGDRAQTAMALAILPSSATIAPLSTTATLDVVTALLRRSGPEGRRRPRESRIDDRARGAACSTSPIMTADAGGAEAGAFDLVLDARRASLDLPTRHPAPGRTSA